MLIAGLFSNAAIAASGDGTADLTTGYCKCYMLQSLLLVMGEQANFIPAGKNNYKMEFTFTTGYF